MHREGEGGEGVSYFSLKTWQMDARHFANMSITEARRIVLRSLSFDPLAKCQSKRLGNSGDISDFDPGLRDYSPDKSRPNRTRDTTRDDRRHGHEI